MPRVSVATDNFNRADGAIGSNWGQLYTSLNSMNVESNQARANFGGADATSRWVGAGTFTDNQYAVVEVQGYSVQLATGDRIGAVVRASADTDANRDLYFYRLKASLSPGTGVPTELGKVVNGTETVLDTGTIGWVNGDTIEMEVEGTTLRGYKNGVLQVTLTDSALSTGLPGFLIDNVVMRGDNWVGGNITSSVVYGKGTSTR